MTIDDAATAASSSGTATPVVAPQERYVILPGGMFAKPSDIYVESLEGGKGRRSTGTLAMNLQDVLRRYDALEEHYLRLKEENIRYKQLLFELYNTLPASHPATPAVTQSLQDGPPTEIHAIREQPEAIKEEAPIKTSIKTSIVRSPLIQRRAVQRRISRSTRT